ESARRTARLLSSEGWRERCCNHLRDEHERDERAPEHHDGHHAGAEGPEHARAEQLACQPPFARSLPVERSDLLRRATIVQPPPLSLDPGHRAERVRPLDWLRGMVMVLMAVDHASGTFNAGRLVTDSTALYEPGTPLPAAQFLTRWITHLCAPTFVFLAGAS